MPWQLRVIGDPCRVKMSDRLVIQLGVLRGDYIELFERLDKYKADKSEENLRHISSLSGVVTRDIQILIDIAEKAEKDIDAAKGWDVIVDKHRIRNMDSPELSEYKSNLQKHVDEIDDYTQKIKDEIGEQDS
jgi:hypothetical protein